MRKEQRINVEDLTRFASRSAVCVVCARTDISMRFEKFQRRFDVSYFFESPFLGLVRLAFGETMLACPLNPASKCLAFSICMSAPISA